MSYSLSFSEEFFIGEGYSYDGPYPEPSKTPTSVFQAILSAWVSRDSGSHTDRTLWWDLLDAVEEHHSRWNNEVHTWVEEDHESHRFRASVAHRGFVSPDQAFQEIMWVIRRVYTCTDLSVPVEVWVSWDGGVSLNIHDEVTK